MPRHRTGGVTDVKANGKLPTLEKQARTGYRDEGQCDGVAEDRVAWLDGDRRLAGETDALIRAGHDGGAARLQPDIGIVEGHRCRAKGVGEPNASVRSP